MECDTSIEQYLVHNPHVSIPSVSLRPFCNPWLNATYRGQAHIVSIEEVRKHILQYFDTQHVLQSAQFTNPDEGSPRFQRYYIGDQKLTPMRYKTQGHTHDHGAFEASDSIKQCVDTHTRGNWRILAVGFTIPHFEASPHHSINLFHRWGLKDYRAISRSFDSQ